MKCVYCFYFVGLVLWCGAANADMYSALHSVYDTNPVIAAARNAVGVANSELAAARTDMRPYVGLTANAGLASSHFMDKNFDTVPTEIGATFQQNIFQGFSTMAKIKGARGLVAASRASLYATQQDVFLDAINAYINVLNADEVLKLKQNNQHVLQEYYDQCRQKQKVGVLTKTDVAQASARLQAAKYQTIDAQADYDNALETVRRIYGTAENKYSDVILTKVEHLFPQSVDAAEEYAMRNHPIIVALNAQESAARENIVVARKTRLPSVDVRASVMRVNDIPIIDDLRDERVGIYFNMPLYDKGNASANVEKVRYSVAEIQEKIVDARRVIVEHLHQAWNNYDAQTYAITSATAAVTANRLALDGTREEQARGRRTVLDVLNAEQELLNSRVALSRAKHGQVAAYFAVLAAMGKLSAENLGLQTHDDKE